MSLTTVAKLKEHLETLPPEALIFIPVDFDGAETAYCSICHVSVDSDLKLNECSEDVCTEEREEGQTLIGDNDIMVVIVPNG